MGKMVKMIATKAQTYDNRTIEADEEFEVDEQYAGTLVGLSRARRADEGSIKTRVTGTRSQEAEADEGEGEGEEENGKKTSGRYQTRRMKAKE